MLQQSPQQQVEEHIANLLSIGLPRIQVAEKAFNFAMELLSEQQEEGTFTSAATMFQAGELVKNAMPGGYRIYEVRNRMH